ncbi:ComF family protein [Candidatus Aminicenantes bacterium AC-708-M15]|nr:ComF family protein [SCandidatus Aminicenantes bacterium Aminicenantia_JdfR_composite]MCP2596812.1 ComF family protein [Candidatus Aminicenantes bacterium AC-335-G13]MCP2598273.1 ComF family protein [Candidatus Aminicenantes bacterium AC-335-L06]MCP2604012.1 ComF family protein [Candidatus Aminicenantes bacterium AC-708-M15]MCP2606501.1 ComF family protein [Candidatus Aminicenantes bacterium AC-708-I09]MCP2618495.1 ComF family protein [Candidatus Aminicenantes bacterium AC-335-A11]MCP26209
MNNSLKNVINLIEVLLFPSYCEICSSFLESFEEKVICNECWEKIIPYRGQICLKCGKAIKSSFYQPHYCQHCLTNVPTFSLHRSFGKYEGVLKDIILLFKFKRKRVLGKKLGYLAYETLKANPIFLKSEVIIPVPLYPKREKERGFNQCEIIAIELEKLTNIRFLKNVLIKIKDTPPQSVLDFKKRKNNVKGAFYVKNSLHIYKKNVLLIDDVYTSGSTIMECSKILKKAGAKEIFVLTLAQTV